MQYFVSKTSPRAILVHVRSGRSACSKGLQEVVKKEKIDTAAITGGIGSFQRVHLHTITTTGFPTADKYWNFTGAIELASVQGSVIGGDVHAHIAVFDWDSKQTYIGHLEPGSVVAYRAEVSLTVLEGVADRAVQRRRGQFPHSGEEAESTKSRIDNRQPTTDNRDIVIDRLFIVRFSFLIEEVIMDVRRVAVAGTGLMGPGIAAVYALAGCEAVIVSRTAENAAKGVETAKGLIAKLVENGLADPAEAKAAAGRFSASTSPEEAVRSVQLFVESIAENLAVKQEYFARLDKAAPDTILCSNTSGISITEIAAKCSRPERVLTTHFWNPPYLMPLVEVIMGKRTDPAIAEGVVALLKACGKVPVLVRKDVPGQLGQSHPARHDPRVHVHRGGRDRYGRGRGPGGEGGRRASLPGVRGVRARGLGRAGAGQGGAGLRGARSEQGPGRLAHPQPEDRQGRDGRECRQGLPRLAGRQGGAGAGPPRRLHHGVSPPGAGGEV